MSFRPAAYLRAAFAALGDLRLQRKVAAVSLQAALGKRRSPREIRRLAGRAVRSRLRSNWAFLRLSPRSTGFAILENADAFLRLHRAGRGFVACTLHAGPYFLLPLQAGRLGLDGKVLMSPKVRALAGGRILSIARHLGRRIDILSADRPDSLLRALRGLQAGQPVMAVLDENLGAGGWGGRVRAGVEVPFLGHPVRFRTALLRVAAKARVPLVLFLASWEGRGRSRLECSDPLEIGDETEAQIEETARRAFGWFELRLLRQPEHWNGWFEPHLLWREDRAPTAAEEDLAREEKHLARVFRQPGSVRLGVDPLRLVFLRPEAGSRLLYDGTLRRVFRLGPGAGALVDAGMRRRSVAWAARQAGRPATQLAGEAARLGLAGLLSIRDRSA